VIADASRPGSAAGMPPEADPVALPVTFRPALTRAVLLTVGAVLVVTFAVVALVLPDPWTVADRAVMIAAGLVIFGILALLSRPKVRADRDGVTVVNLVTSRRLAWAEVLNVNLRPGDPWVYLDLADGTSMAAMGIQPGMAPARAVRDAGRLRRLAETHGTGDPAAG
jgi:hypothetical protein